MRQRLSSLLVAAFVLLGGSWLLFAQTSVPSTSAVPYQGHLELSGDAVTGMYPLTFSFWDAPVGGSKIGSDVVRTVNVVNGTFSTVLAPVPASAFAEADLFLQIAVDGTVLAGRQQLLSVPFALGSVGGNDMNVSGALLLGGGLGELAYDEASDELSLSNAGTGLVIESSGRGVFEKGLSVVGNATVSRDVTVSEDVSVSGRLSLGALSNGCPTGMDRAGLWCIDDNMRQAQAWTTAMSTCHNAGLGLCPLEAYIACDQLNTNSNSGDLVTSCGDATDDSAPARLLTSTQADPLYTYSSTYPGPIVGHDGYDSYMFDHLLCYDPAGSGGENINSLDGCTSASAEAFFCCIGATAVGFEP